MWEFSEKRVKYTLSELSKISSNWTKFCMAGFGRDKNKFLAALESLAMKQIKEEVDFHLKYK